MTISTTTNRVSFTGDGVSTSFSFPYFVIAAADLKVYQEGTLKTLTTHYTLSGSAPYTSGTNVQFVTAPTINNKIIILRDPAITQAVDITDNDPLPAASIETPLDRLTMICQRLADRISRAFTLSDSDVSGASLTLPTPAASKLIGWDSAGTALANYAAATITDSIVPSAFAETLLDDTSASAARSTLGAFASAGGTISGDVIVTGTALLQGDVTLDTGKAVIFEGATADAFETTLGVVDPTADRTILLQNASGTLAFTSDIPVTSVNGNTGAVRTITLGTPSNTTGGTSIDFAVPSGVREINVAWAGLSTSGTSPIIIQLGDAGGIETSGYVSAAGDYAGDTSSTAGFVVAVPVAAGTNHGRYTLQLIDSATFLWGGCGCNWNSSNTQHAGAGSKSTSAETTTVRITMANGSDTFDANTYVNVSYT